jgi:hypothetical protein
MMTAMVMLLGKMIKSWPMVALSFESVNIVLIHMEKDSSDIPKSNVPMARA